MKYASYSLLLFWKNAQQITTATKLNYPFGTSTSQHSHTALYQTRLKARDIKTKKSFVYFSVSAKVSLPFRKKVLLLCHLIAIPLPVSSPLPFSLPSSSAYCRCQWKVWVTFGWKQCWSKRNETGQNWQVSEQKVNSSCLLASENCSTAQLNSEDSHLTHKHTRFYWSRLKNFQSHPAEIALTAYRNKTTILQIWSFKNYPKFCLCTSALS